MSVVTTVPFVETSTEIAQQHVNESKVGTNVLVRRRVGRSTGGLAAYRHHHKDLESNLHSRDQKSRLTTKLAGSCSVYNCSNHRQTCPGKTFFRYPKDKLRCELWLKNCKRKDLINVRRKYFYNVYRVCEDHFEDHCFLSFLRNRLHDNAVPTIFEQNTVKKEIENDDKIYETDSELKSFQNENLISNDDDDYDYDDEDDKTKIFIDSEETKDMLNINNIMKENVENNFSIFNDDDKQEGKERKWCAAVSCEHEITSQSEGLQFFKFPEDYEMCKKWAMHCHRTDLINISSNYLHNNYVLCSDHFQSSEFADNDKKILKADAVPNIEINKPLFSQS